MTKREELEQRISNLKSTLAHSQNIETINVLKDTLAELEEELRNLGGQQLLIEG